MGIDLDRSIDTDSPVFLQGGTVMQTFSLRVKLVVIVRGVLMVLEKRLIDRKLLFSMSLVSPRSYPRRSSMRPTRSARSRSPLISHTLGRFRMCGTSLQIFHASQKHGDEALRRRKYLDDLTKRGKYKLPGDEDMIKKLRDIAKRLGMRAHPRFPLFDVGQPNTLART